MKIVCIKYIYIILLLVLLFNCSEDPTYNNPYSSNYDPEEWMPANLQIEQQNIHTVKLSWKQVEENINGFKIDRKVDTSDWEIEYTTVDKKNKSYIDTAAIPTHENRYRIYAYADENSSAPLEKQITPEFPAPDSLEIEQLSVNELKLSWNDNSDGEDGFKIDRKIESGDWEELIDLAENQTTFNDTTAIPDQNYYYRVYAYKNEQRSNKVEKEITAGFPAPTNLRLEQNSDVKATLTWTDNSKGEDGYKIDRKTGSNDWNTEYIILPANTTEFIDKDPVYGVTNSYRICAYKDKYTSSYILGEYENIIPAPNLSSEAIDDQSLKLIWIDNCDFENGYTVERKSGGSYSEIAQLSADITTYIDEGLSYGTTYQYRVRAKTDNNNSEYSNEVITQTVFPAPTDLTCDALDDQSISLSWTDNCDFENGYKIERKKSGGAYSEITQLSPNTIKYTDDNLDYKTTYYYRIRAHTDENSSDYSNEVSSATKIIQAPTNLDLQVLNNNTITLTWKDNSDFETGYKIERKQVGEAYKHITQISENTTKYIDNTLSINEIYSYKIYATTENNKSSFEESKKTICNTDFVYVESGQTTSDNGSISLNYDAIIGRYEVTFAEYIEYCNATGESIPDDEGWGRNQRPVINVNWYDAVLYCNWRSKEEGLNPAYDLSGNKDSWSLKNDPENLEGYRLPLYKTNEWEYIARGGKSGNDTKYSGSNNLEEVGWYENNSNGKSHLIGDKHPNELGIYDMSGNVGEWTNSLFPDYEYKWHIRCGGGWDQSENRCSVGVGYSGDTDTHYSNTGFRIIRTIK